MRTKNILNEIKVNRIKETLNSVAELHISVEHVHTFLTPTSGIVSFIHVPFGTLEEIEHIRRVYL